MKTVWVYLRVSTKAQENEKFEKAVKFYLKANKIKGVIKTIKEKVKGSTPWQKRELAKIINESKAGDIVVTPEISRLSRDFFMTMDIINKLMEKDVPIHSLKPEVVIIEKGMTSKDKCFVSHFALKAETDSVATSCRLKEAASTKNIGRPKIDTSKLDENSSEILILHERGWKSETLAKQFGYSNYTMKRWIKNHE